MAIEVKKGLLGGYSVGYHCPHCKARLKSALSEAGKPDRCPECKREFVVPGVEERERIEAHDAAERQRKEEEKEIAKQEKAADRLRRREEANQWREDLRQKSEARRQEAAELEKKWAESQAALPPAQRQLAQGDIICSNPNCGYVGQPKKIARGSTGVGCLLCFIMLLPGLIYFIFMSGYDYVCPRCGLHIRSGRRD